MKNTKYMLAQLLMLKRIIDFSVANSTVTNSIPALKNAFIALTAKVSTIEQLLSRYRLIITGYATAKNQARVDLANAGYVVMKAAYAYAKDTNNALLAAEMKTNLSKLRKMGYASIVSKTQAAITSVTPVVGSLATYDLTITADMTTWNTKLTAMIANLNLPQAAILSRKNIGNEITLDMNDAMNLARNTIDSLVSSMFSAYVDYHNGYFTQREILDPGHRHNAIEAHLQDELSQPFGPDIKVTVDEWTDPNTGKTYEAVSSYTDINGNATVKKFFPGPRTVTVSGDGVVEKTFGPFAFTHGKTIAAVLTCQPQFSDMPVVQTETEELKAIK